MFLHIVLRGISGVGKTTLRNKLVDFFKKHGCLVVVFSKDLIRKELKYILGTQYIYSNAQEKMCRSLYRMRLLNFFKKPCGKFADPNQHVVVISDCTNVSLDALHDSCFYWEPKEAPFYHELLKNTQQVLIEIGSGFSESRTSRPGTNKAVIMRQALAMLDSDAAVKHWTLYTRGLPLFNIPAHSSLEQGIEEMGSQLLGYFDFFCEYPSFDG